MKENNKYVITALSAYKKEQYSYSEKCEQSSEKENNNMFYARRTYKSAQLLIAFVCSIMQRVKTIAILTISGLSIRLANDLEFSGLDEAEMQYH